MEFKAGDRVHVTRFRGEDVDFYATLQELNNFIGISLYRLVNCTDYDYQNHVVCIENSDLYGERYYYTLVTDEEDTEPVEVQHIKRENKIELDNHYIIEVKKGLYIKEVSSTYFFEFTKDINEAKIYEHKQSNIRHAELVDGRILNLKRYVEE